MSLIKKFIKKNKICVSDVISDLEKFKEAKILIIGDLIIDRYTYCNAIGKTAKTPTLSVKKINSEEFFGGSSLFLANILGLGAKCELITSVGNDYGLKFLRSRNLINIKYIINKKKPTTVKERFIVDGYKLLQVDVVDNADVDKKTEKKIFNLFKKKIINYNTVLLSDSRHGLFTKDLIKKISVYCKKNKKKIIVDTQVSNVRGNLENYRKVADVISVNDNEARYFLRDWESKNKIIFIKILKALTAKTLFYKMGVNGVMAKNVNKNFYFPSIPVNVLDPIGSGDAFLSSASLCDNLKVKFPNNILISSCCAALSCSYMGTKPIKILDLKNFILKLFKDLNV
jgi:rfaE bifunctional protein kinase chain/domain